MTCPPPHPEAVAWIESYARCELSLEDLCGKVRGVLGKQMIHNPKMRLVNLNQISPAQSVRITPQHIEILFAKRRRGEITERQMIDWGTMLMINDCYHWDPLDAEVAEWISFLHLDLVPKD
jgi:hypothetical protein